MTINGWEEHGECPVSPSGSVQCGRKNTFHLRALQGTGAPQEGTWFHKEHTHHYVMELNIFLIHCPQMWVVFFSLCTLEKFPRLDLRRTQAGYVVK